MSQDLVLELRLGYVAEPLPGDSWYDGCISIPYIQPAGISWMKFRSITDSGDKYRTIPGLATRIYNTPALQTAREIVVTEGEFDCMTFLEIGIPAISIPGANNWKKEYSRILRNRVVTVFCDGDQAGKEFGLTLTNTLLDCRIEEAPRGEDANSCLKLYGPEWLREKVS